MALAPFALSSDERVLAGVCAGIARRLGVDPTLVRLLFAMLALAGGAGVVLYLMLWALAKARRRWLAITLAILTAALLLGALGFTSDVVVGLMLVVVGLALALRRGGSFRPNTPLSYGGLALAAFGVLLLPGSEPATVLAPAAVGGTLLLIVGLLAWRLALDRDAERAARVRSEERAEVAARVHDSVLQTLALIQRRAQDPQRVVALARRQERELRAWLNGRRAAGEETVATSLEAAAAEVEEAHGVPVEVVAVGDAPLDPRAQALVAAAREALVNAAKFAGGHPVVLYAEVDPERIEVFVRDRGPGFDPAAVPADRRGVRESIVGRMERHGGRAVVHTAPGEGTEVELVLKR
jgi:signal transduction histidine kinase